MWYFLPLWGIQTISSAASLMVGSVLGSVDSGSVVGGVIGVVVGGIVGMIVGGTETSGIFGTTSMVVGGMDGLLWDGVSRQCSR